MEIGNTLRNARESRGISLETAEEQTKIRRKYLEALESENFGLLPGRVYVKGFIKSYANFLGLSAGSLVSAYEAKVPLEDREDDLPHKRYSRVEKKGGRRAFNIILGIVAVLLAAALIYLPLAGVKPVPPGGPQGKLAGENKTAGGDENQAKPEVPKKSEGVRVILNVTDNQSWMRVEVDGKQAFEGLVPAGQMKEFNGKEKINLRIGNAGVVQVEFNGQKIGALGGYGQVISREFSAPQG